MIHIVIAIDPTTSFLVEIINFLTNENIELGIIKIEPNNESYIRARKLICEIPTGSLILFLGHGQENQLYGGESEEFQKQPFIKDKEMQIFKDQFLFALACNSADLLKRSFRFSGIEKSIGFGALPTEKKEVEDDKRLKTYITEENIESFKSCIVEITSLTFLEIHNQNKTDFNWVKDHISLLINKKINDSILNNQDRGLADLLYNMKSDIKIF